MTDSKPVPFIAYQCGHCGTFWDEEAPWQEHMNRVRERARRDEPVRLWLEAQLRAMREAWKVEACDAQPKKD